MVSFKTLAGAALAALPSATAYITGVKAPKTAAAGSNVTATVATGSYIQNWQDFGIIWGLAKASANCGPNYICVGTQIDYTNIYPKNPQPGNFSVDVTIPAGTLAGDYNLVAAIPYLVGASGMVDVHNFTSSIAITGA